MTWLAVVAGLSLLSGQVFSEPIPTGVTFAVAGRGTTAIQSYELEGNCPLLLLSYSANMIVEAAVPIYRRLAPGDVRLLLLGSVGKQRQVWIGRDNPGGRINTRLPFDNVASIASFSDNDAIIAQANGTISIIDHDGFVLQELSIQDRLSADIDSDKLGDVVRAWRTGSQSLAAVTKKYIIHWNYSSSNMATAIPHNGGKIFTANGDSAHVWLVHESDTPSAVSFSLFSLSTHELLATHEFDIFDSNFPQIYPIYHTPNKGNSFFAIGKKLIAVTQNSKVREIDWQHPEVKRLIHGSAASDLLVFSPPAQGYPYNAEAQKLGWHRPGFLPFGDVTAAVARSAAKMGFRSEPEPTKKVVGVQQTKEELTQYLREQLTENQPGIDNAVVRSQYVSVRFNDSATPMPPALKQAIEGLGPAILGNHGLQYYDGRLILHVSTAKASLSDWVNAIWNNR